MKHWISCSKFTVLVETTPDEKIAMAAPIVFKFRGQPLENLLRWARRLGGFRHEIWKGQEDAQ